MVKFSLGITRDSSLKPLEEKMPDFYPNPHPPGCYWYDTAEKFGAPNVKWCEQTLCHIVSEPANTWSNLGFLVLAAMIFASTRKSQSKTLKWIPWAFGLMGLGSFYYHASNFYISQVLDFIGMYMLIHWFIALNLIRSKTLSFKGALLFYLGFMSLNTLVLHWMYVTNIKFQILVAIAGVLVVITEWYARKKGSRPEKEKWLILGVATIIAGEAFSLLDLSRTLCDPENHFFQGHALWHILSGIGLYFAFRHFEQFKKELP